MPIVTHFTTREAAERLRFGSHDGVIRFLRERGIQPIRRGRLLLWPVQTIDALLKNRGAK